MKDSQVDHLYIDSMERNALRSPEATEMLERPPSKMFRVAGISVISLFVLMLFISIIVRYPDTLDGVAVITTDPLPIKLKSPQMGRITTLYVEDGAQVQPNAVIAELENPTGYKNILRLQRSVDSIKMYVQAGNDEALADMIMHPLQQLGDAQGYYNQLVQQISMKLLMHSEHLYSRRAASLKEQMSRLESISSISANEKSMYDEELKQADERFKANEKLYKSKVISQQEYYDESARLRAKKMQLEQQQASIIQNKMSSGEDSKQIMETEYEAKEKDQTVSIGIMEAISNIYNNMQTWQQRYLVIAPFEGTVNYLRPLQANQSVNGGDELFAVIPTKHSYSAVVSVPSIGIGKVEVGQKVHLMVDNYPYNEYGFIEGKVRKRSSMQVVGDHGVSQVASYQVYVQLSDTLETNYKKPIAFAPEMTASARIITKDRNLLQRFVSGIAKTSK
jgi:multidrug resistance efflux pump